MSKPSKRSKPRSKPAKERNPNPPASIEAVAAPEVTEGELEANGVKDSFGLNARQKAFVDALFRLNRNATAAYKAAGYECKDDTVAAVCASTLLRNTKVVAYLRYREDGLAKAFQLDEARVMQEVAYAALLDPLDLTNPDGSRRKLSEIEPHARRALESCETDEAGYVINFKTGKQAALAKAMRILRMDREATTPPGGQLTMPIPDGAEVYVAVKPKMSAEEAYRAMLDGTGD